jgi:hypothetical protein
MNITKDILNDLLPGYLSGDASGDTCKLIEETIHSDATFAREVETQRSELAGHLRALRSSRPMPAPDHEVKTLQRTRALIDRRKWMLGMALMFTAFPFSFIFDNGGIRFLLLREQPSLACACWAAAVGFWIGLILLNNRLRDSGL